MTASPRPFLKRLAPENLFGRALLLIVMPVVLLQIVTTYVFYERHWEEITRRLAVPVVGEIASVIDEMNDNPTAAARRAIFARAALNLDLDFRFFPGMDLPPGPPVRRPFYAILERTLSETLQTQLGLPYRINAASDPDYVDIRLQLPAGVLQVEVPEKRLFSTTTYIFIFWTVGTSVVLLAIAIAFLRNQVRPIRLLAEAADSFGKGREVSNFRPAGAREIRRAAAAFLMMRERIQRQIAQRTEMLAGVSHDLRTPLTRIKLELALLGDRSEAREMNRDVAEMERMIDGFLAFARGQDAETAVATDVSEILRQVIRDTERQHHGRATLETVSPLLGTVRPNALKRCVTNLVDNALRYSQHVAIAAHGDDEAIEITVDDDGPGVPAARRDDVFRPFFRLDPARNPLTGGVGLGLAVARDIVHGHGGDITLGEAPQGGLRVRLRLPV